MTHPSGDQYEIAFGTQHATIVEVGGGIRSFVDDGRDVLQPYPVEAMCDGAHGTPLIPWPNRLADGRYSFDGTDYQVPLTEPTKSNAIHGFLRWRPWQMLDHQDDRVTMAVRLHPLKGYPFQLDVRVDYVLTDDGLTVTTEATNSGDAALPYGDGQHPYLSPGEGALVDDCTLHLDAATRITTDPERQLPTGEVPVADTPYDFREPRTIGDTAIDYAFVDLARDEHGLAWVHLAGPDGRTASAWVDDSYPIIELYTADTLDPSRRRRGLGTEPMTCPPNALASGKRVIRLEPGESTRASWGARLE